MEAVRRPDVEAASTYDGPRPGYAFKTGPQGLGYYADSIDLTRDEAPAPAPASIDLTQDEAPKPETAVPAPKRKTVPAAAVPPKTRRRTEKLSRADLEARIMAWKTPPIKQLVWPHEQHVNAYKSFELEVRTALKKEEPSLVFAELNFDDSDRTWMMVLNNSADDLPAPGLPITTMSKTLTFAPDLDAILKDTENGTWTAESGKVRMSSDLEAMLTDDSITLEMVFLEQAGFLNMMRLAGDGPLGRDLYPKALAWVWALLKQKHDPNGASMMKPEAFCAESRLFSQRAREYYKQQHRENVRAEFGDEGVEIFDRKIGIYI